MAFWKKLGVFLGGAGTRSVGIQSGSPNSFSSASAVPVTVDTALQISATWACVKLIAECVGSLPIKIYDVDAKGVRTLNTTHPLAGLFAGKVNRWQTRQEFFETLTYQLTLMGNNYSVIQRNSKKEIIALVPLMSEQMEVVLQGDGSVQYRYTDGTHMNVYAQETIWHNKIFGNGIIGLSPLSYARNSLGIAQAAETSVTKIYKNGGKPSGVLTIDKVLTDLQRAAIKQNFAQLAEGNDDRLFVLEAGMKYQQVSLSPQDVELLSTRKFQTEDIARFFGVPSVLINDTSTSTAWGSGIQQIVQGFYKLGLRPYLERYEASIKAWLLTPEERVKMDIEFDFEALLRADRAERMKSGKEGVQGGLLTPNEWRKEEGLEPKEGGDSLLVQQQMVALEKLGDVPRGVPPNNPPPPAAMAMATPQATQEIHVHIPEIKNTVKVPATVVNVTNSEPAINIKNEITNPAVRVAAPKVNVAAPVVHVAAPNVEVAAPIVNVKNEAPEVKVILPKRKSETTLKYNKDGDVTSTTQIEEDL